MSLRAFLWPKEVYFGVSENLPENRGLVWRGGGAGFINLKIPYRAVPHFLGIDTRIILYKISTSSSWPVKALEWNTQGAWKRARPCGTSRRTVEKETAAVDRTWGQPTNTQTIRRTQMEKSRSPNLSLAREKPVTIFACGFASNTWFEYSLGQLRDLARDRNEWRSLLDAPAKER